MKDIHKALSSCGMWWLRETLSSADQAAIPSSFHVFPGRKSERIPMDAGFLQVLLFYPDGKRSSSTEGQVNQGGGAAAIAAQPHFPGNEAQPPAPVPQDGQAVLPGPHMPGAAQAAEMRGRFFALPLNTQSLLWEFTLQS